jgi:hypothetical protein
MEAANQARAYTSIESHASKSRGAPGACAKEDKEKDAIAICL